MIANTTPATEIDILAHVVMPEEPLLKAELAHCVLEMQFDDAATANIRELLEKNNRGTLSDSERNLLDRYLRVGEFIDLLQAKARVTLQGTSKD